VSGAEKTEAAIHLLFLSHHSRGVEEASVGVARPSPQLFAADATSTLSEGRIADVVVDVGKESV
jgi:hypothetical protein